MISFVLRLLVLAMAFVVLSCGGSGLSDENDFPSQGGDDITDTLDTSTFAISVANDEELLNYHVRTDTSFGTSCSVAQSASNQDLTCYVDVPEGDLYFYGLDFVYNVPAGMCKYLRKTTYWYYNEEVGYGPTSIVLDVELNADGTAITAATCNVDGAGAVPCNTNFDEVEFVVSGTDIKPVCKYDLTEAELGNCCLGSYNLDKTVTTNSAPPTVVASNTTQYWSGKTIDNTCFGGPGKTNWDFYTRGGYPASIIEFVGDGAKSGLIEASAPIRTTNTGSNIPVSNFFTVGTHTHGSFGTGSTSTFPYYVEPLTDRNGTPIVSGNSPYTFECLDEAFEVQHRLRAYVREWDTYADYLAYIASNGVTSVPDRPGVENTNCDGVVGPCNDAIDPDNFLSALPGAVYQTVTPATRRLNFPYDLYD
jgi:hypothetical protein